jgi:hypothetical protein
VPDPTAAPQPSEGDDLRADLESAWSQEAPESDAPAPDSAPASASAPPSEADAGRARGPDGKFVKGSAQTQAPQGAAEPSAPAQAAPTQPGEFKVPEKWPADIKAKLQAIHATNPEHAQFVLEQYNAMRSIAAQHQARAQEHLKSYEQYLAPTRQERAMRGIDDGTHIKHLLAGDDFMRKNPADGIRWLAQQHGLDLAKLANPEAGGEPEIPPYVRQMQQELQQFKQMFQQQAVGMEQQQLEAASGWIDSFANQADAQGNKLYPYFDEVLPEIIFGVQYQMQNGHAVDVKAAYDRAIRLNDQVWLKDQRARSEAASKATTAQRQREIEDAKRAGITVSGSGADTTHAPGSIREELLRAFDSAG